MITDLECAELCLASYGTPTDWVKFDPGEDDGVCWGLVEKGGCNVIVLRGSATFQDWIRDLIALANPFVHHQLGPVHPGFLLGLDHAWTEMKTMISDLPLVFTGHSLGAGRGAILTGMAIADGIVAERRVSFGEPKPGFAALASYIQQVPAASYRNADGSGHDLITDVPFSFPPEEYVHPLALTDVKAVPQSFDWGPFSYHHMTLYVQALGGNI